MTFRDADITRIMENRPSAHPRIHAVETPVDSPEQEGPRPDLEIAFYPERVDRDSAPVALTPSQAVRYTEDPGRAAAAAQTAGSRQRLEVSMAALWSETGATEGRRGATSRPIEPAAASEVETSRAATAEPAPDPAPRSEAASTAPTPAAPDADDPFASLEQSAEQATGAQRPVADEPAEAQEQPAGSLDAAHADLDAAARTDLDAPHADLEPASADTDGDFEAAHREAQAEDEGRQPWWAAARTRSRAPWWRRLLGRG